MEKRRARNLEQKKDYWLLELKNIIETQEEKIRGVVRARVRRETARAKKLEEMKKLVLKNLTAVQTLFTKERPKIELKDDTNEILFLMPKLSDVNHIDLVFQFEASDTGGLIRAVRRSAREDRILSETREEFEPWTKDIIKRFILAYYNRRLSDELDKERAFAIAITARGIK